MKKQTSCLNLLDCLDSEEIADTNRNELLNITWTELKELGESSVEASQKGYYLNLAGERIDWSSQVKNACSAKVSIAPDDPLPNNNQNFFTETNVQVSNETTLQASKRFVENGQRPLALNFANGCIPGGSFREGARAQEEALCRSSALHQTLIDDPMYEHHLQREDFNSTNWAIYSPDVPVFRMDNGTN